MGHLAPAFFVGIVGGRNLSILWLEELILGLSAPVPHILYKATQHIYIVPCLSCVSIFQSFILHMDEETLLLHPHYMYVHEVAIPLSEECELRAFGCFNVQKY